MFMFKAINLRNMTSLITITRKMSSIPKDRLKHKIAIVTASTEG